MRILRARHGQIVWRQRALSGVANSAVSVRLFTKRGDPIVWRSRPLAGTVSGAVSESTVITDAVSAIFVGTVSASESLTLSDSETYPVTTFGQTINRGRNPPIVWRQREAVATGTPFSGSFADALSLLDSSTASQAFSLSTIAESFTVTDTNSPVGGSSVVGVVEAETVAESIATVWTFNSAIAEALSAVDAQDGLGGSPATATGAGHGSGHGREPHKPRKAVEINGRIFYEEEPEEKPVDAKPRPNRRARRAAQREKQEIKQAEQPVETTEDEEAILLLLLNG